MSDHEKGSAEKGIDIIRKYWQNYEADSLELFMYDGSGLARNNKVSAKYLNCVLKETARDSLIGEYFVQTLPLAGKEGCVLYLRDSRTDSETMSFPGVDRDWSFYLYSSCLKFFL